jgi:hypothetical protein
MKVITTTFLKCKRYSVLKVREKKTFQVSEDALGGAEHFGAQHNGWVDDNHIQFFVSR